MATRTTTTTKTKVITETTTVTRSSSSNRTVSISVVIAVALTLSAIFAALKARADVVELDQAEVKCLAMNIYYEAGRTSDQGQYAVAHTTLNRTKYNGFPTTICGVVYEKTFVKFKDSTIEVCQFSWVCEKRKINIKDDAYLSVEIVAINVLSGKSVDQTGGATNFYSTTIREPQWARVCTKTVAIGGNQFLRLHRLVLR